MHTKAVIKTAICSRLAVIVLQFFGNHLIKDHDAGVFLSPIKGDADFSVSNELIQGALGGFLRWDAQYFTHIAKYGYTYENTLAFFPLYPMLIAMFSRLLILIFPFVSMECSLLFTGVVLNCVLFVLAAVSLYRLSKLVLYKEDLAFKAALSFCFNPATIFFSAPYTETLYAYLTFIGLAELVRLYKNGFTLKKPFTYSDFLFVVPLSASTCTRSNGLLNVGFWFYYFLSFYHYRMLDSMRNSSLKINFVVALAVLSTFAFVSIICLTPFNVYQIYAYDLFCRDLNITFPENVVKYAADNNFILAGTFSYHNRTWCYQSIPFSYAYVQARYWNVGFLRYYTIKQLPNFALALPITFLILKCGCEFIYHHSNMICYPFLPNEKCKRFLPRGAFVFVVHAMFLVIFNFLCINVQVSTRILCSSSPVLYWYCAHVFRDVPVNDLLTFKNRVRLSVLQSFIKYYFIIYFVVGTVLFCNFFPWT